MQALRNALRFTAELQAVGRLVVGRNWRDALKQLYLFKAREAAEKEVQEALDATGQTMEEVRAYIKANPELENPLRLPPHRAACMAADTPVVSRFIAFP